MTVSKRQLIQQKQCILAERVGFEPTVPFQVRRISSAVLSTTQPPLQGVERVRRGTRCERKARNLAMRTPSRKIGRERLRRLRRPVGFRLGHAQNRRRHRAARRIGNELRRAVFDGGLQTR